MSMKKLFCLVLSMTWCWAFTVSAEVESSKGDLMDAPKVEEGQVQGGSFGEYLSQEEMSSTEETTPENELLAPVAKPVVTIIEGVGSAIEPLLEEKEIKDEKGRTKAKIKPKEGKFLEVEF